MKRALIVTVLLLAANHAGAQSGQSPPSTFRVGVDYVAVDASVTDPQGNPVAGLTREDFELSEDGKPQRIETVSSVEIGSQEPALFMGLDGPVPVDVRSNRQPFSGRLYVIVLDDANVSPVRSTDVQRQARKFVESHFHTGDVAAVAYTSGRTDGSQDFTADRGLLLASIDKFAGLRARSAALEAAEKCYAQMAMAAGMQNGASDGAEATQSGGQTPTGGQNGAAQGGPSMQAGGECQGSDQIENERQKALGTHGPSVDIDDFARAQRAIAVLDKLRALSDVLAPVRGRRKALIMFSEGIDYQMSYPFGMRSVTDVLRAVQDAIKAAARANVNFYTIDPRGLAGMTSEFMQMRRGIDATQGALADEFHTSQDSLRTLAEETGGFASLSSNAFTSAFDRIVERNSRYVRRVTIRPITRQTAGFTKSACA